MTTDIEKIDFVITWVDGSDQAWLSEKRKYEGKADTSDDKRDVRYRDLDFLKYWFRAVETNAPWVHKIYFVTWGHTPKWLNTDNEKLVIVKHSDFIPKQYLPTFNSCAIEMNLHRIKGLSENFVYFNDDMYVLNKTKPTDFFKHGLPRDAAIPDAIIPSGKDDFEHVLVNNSIVINKRYKLRKVILKNPTKWLNIRYGLHQINTLYFLLRRNFSTLRPSHLPCSLTKSAFELLWKEEEATMKKTSAQRFRNIAGVNPWVVQDLQIVSGNFYPRTPRIGKYIGLKDSTLNEVVELVKNKRFKLICINDSAEIKNLAYAKKEVAKAFEKKFPKKSSFEIQTREGAMREY